MSTTIVTLAFQPSHYTHLGFETSTVAALRQRAGALLARPQRLQFFSLIVFTAGETRHMVDFQPVSCQAGDALLLAPQQVFQLDVPANVEGYVIIYRPDFLPHEDSIQQLLADETGQTPIRFRATDEDTRRLLCNDCESLLQAYMRYDHTALAARILSYQLRIALTRLAQLRRPERSAQPESASYAALMQRFRQLVEQHYRHSRALSSYARQLYCSPKTLQRAIASCTGQSGKRYIDARVMLEAKRLLAHTNDPVGAIGTFLGFSEPTNFIKYFQRLEGLSPERFRQRYRYSGGQDYCANAMGPA